ARAGLGRDRRGRVDRGRARERAARAARAAADEPAAAPGRRAAAPTRALPAWPKPPPRRPRPGGSPPETPPRVRRRALFVAVLATVAALALVGASLRGQVPAAGAFFGAGFGLLTAALALTWHRLTVPRPDATVRSALGLGLRN